MKAILASLAIGIGLAGPAGAAEVGSYEGERRDGQPHGQGTMAFPDGGRYVGEWRNGERHGKGTMTFPDGARYEGDWENGKPHGQGTLRYPFASHFVVGGFTGEWKIGVPFAGEWRDGVPVEDGSK